MAALGVVIGAALVFLGIGAFQPESPDPPAVIVPNPGTTDPGDDTGP